MSTFKCDRCGREAVVHRKYSGESLCPSCLRDSLITRIRRTISKYRLLERVGKVTYLSLGWPYEKVLADMFMEIESKFQVEVTFSGCKDSPLSLKEAFKCPSGRWERLVKALRSVRWEGKIVVPLTLDDVIALYLRSIALGPSIMVLKGRIVLDLKEEPNVVTPFSEVPLDELLSLYTGKKNYEEDLIPIFVNNSFVLREWELERGNPGMRYSFYRAMQRLGLDSWLK